MAHGEEAALSAAETARRTFEEGTAGEDLPVITVPAAELAAGIAAYELLVRAGLAPSRKEARRAIQGGGARLNGVKIDDEQRPITSADLDGGQIKLSAGRKRHALVKPI